VHEASIAQSILDIVAAHARDAGGGRVTRVTVKVGALAAVVPECLKFAFDALARGSCAEGAALEVEETEGRGACRACGEEFAAREFLPVCVRCGSPDVAVAGGEDLTVDSMEIE
jgi:hydrogenase nickel incorporation protein HypA/HybF